MLVKTQSKEDISVCPMCGTGVPKDADECPKCGEPFSPEAIAAKEKGARRGSKMMFLVGLILVIIGGPGVALGSWAHDVLGISIAGYDNFESFGWVNQLVSIVGIIILVIGIIILILSLSHIEKEALNEIEDSDEPVPKNDSEQGG